MVAFEIKAGESLFEKKSIVELFVEITLKIKNSQKTVRFK
jgi:hypothetical protein